MRVILADDLGLCILSLIQSREEGTSSQVVQGCLNVFMALRCAVGPCLRIVVECFMKQVFIRSLLQISSAIEVAEQVTQLRLIISNHAIVIVLSLVSFSGNFAELGYPGWRHSSISALARGRRRSLQRG